LVGFEQHRNIPLQMRDGMVDALGDALARNQKARVLGLGSFTAKPTKARLGRNPRTAESVQIKAGMKVKFACSKLLFEDVAADFVKRHCMVKNKRWREQEKQLAAYVLPSWTGRDIGSLRRRDVVALMDELTDRGPTTSVNRVLSLVHKLFRWAQGRDLIDANPASGVAKPAKENIRDRVLSEKEITALWSVTGHMG
jgi:nucleoid DNA-binding protein